MIHLIRSDPCARSFIHVLYVSVRVSYGSHEGLCTQSCSICENMAHLPFTSPHKKDCQQNLLHGNTRN
jgi:hypothetical protein